MNKSTIRVITVIGVVLLLSGCNKKESHFEDDGNLLCTESDRDDVISAVGSDKAYVGTKYHAHGLKRTVVFLRSGRTCFIEHYMVYMTVE